MQLAVRFFRSQNGNEPVRYWLLEQTPDVRRRIGLDIKTVQLGWPLGMPVVRKMDKELWEIRTRFPGGIARVLFTLMGQEAILLHGFIKKSRTTPRGDLDLARQRNSILRGKAND